MREHKNDQVGQWQKWLLVSTYVVCERLSVMHKQVCVHIPQTVKFVSKFSRKPLSGISDRKAPPHPDWKTSDLRWPKFTLEYLPPPTEKLQIWDDKSLLQNTPPQLKNFRFEMTKVYSGMPPSPHRLAIWEIVCGD